MTETAPEPLTPDQLRRAADPAELGFDSTRDLEVLRTGIGQDLAMEAVDFGLHLDHPGYNIFAVGLPGSGRSTMIRQRLERRASEEPVPCDWCYVYNFDDPRAPNALEVPPGRGPELESDIDEFLTDIRNELPKALESDEFRQRVDEIAENARETQRRMLQELRGRIEEEADVTLLQTPGGFVVAPARGNEALGDEQLRNLPDEERERIQNRRREVEKEFADVQRRVQDAERQARQRIRGLQREVAQQVVERCVTGLRDRWGDVDEIDDHLDRLAEDIVENAEQFTDSEEESQLPAFLRQGQDPEQILDRYRVNVLVSNDPDGGAPVVYESNPSYHNLIGRIEHRVQFGTMVTNFQDLTAGAFHRANGGYLILEAADVLTQPFAWPALKRALRTQQVRLEELSEYTSLVATATLKPEPVDLDCRVIIIGDPRVYHLLHLLDEDFRELFKVKADFSPHMDRDGDAERRYGQFVATRCQEESLPPFGADAIARIIEFGSRQAGVQDRLTTRFGEVADLVREAAFQAGRNGRDQVGADDVRSAVRAREDRVNRLEREMLELIEEDVLAVEPTGEVVGQIFGLGVLSVSDHTFARPIKVEASAFMGTSGVVDIEREVRLGGPLHNKGVLVLSGYLGERFAQSHPLILSASLSFDQMYDEVEGDSASAAELFALISAIAGVPIRQGVAITGAMNQKGDIQPIGGATTKIEGFYRACRRRGLTGDQGVIVPARNRRNLVLTDEVIEAVEEGQFNIWSIRRVEEGWPLLTGLPAGERDADGGYPEDSVYGRAAARLEDWARGWREFGRPVRKGRQLEERPSAGAADEGATDGERP